MPRNITIYYQKLNLTVYFTISFTSICYLSKKCITKNCTGYLHRRAGVKEITTLLSRRPVVNEEEMRPVSEFFLV